MNKKEIGYITSIIEDINSDIANSKITLDHLNNTIKGLDSLLYELSSESIYTDSKKSR